MSIVDRIREDSKKFCSRDEALEIVMKLVTRGPLAKFPSQLSDLYELVLSREDGDPPNQAAIGTWLDQNKDEKGYFANPHAEAEPYTERVLRNPNSLNLTMMRFAGKLDEEEAYKTVSRLRNVIRGFVTTADMPFRLLKVRLEPQSANLSPEECYVVPILSRTHMRLFWAFRHFVSVDCDTTQAVGKIEWQTGEALLKKQHKIDELVEAIVSKFAAFVEDPLTAKRSAVASAMQADDTVSTIGKPEAPWLASGT
jgi:hypothetical protein